MITGLEKLNPFVANLVHESVLLRNAPRPAPGQSISQPFRLTQAFEWIANGSLDKVKNSDRCVAFRFHPVAQVLKELFVKDCLAATAPSQSSSPAADVRPIQVSSFLPPPVSAQIADAARYEGNAADERSPSNRKARQQVPAQHLLSPFGGR
jgi:hypothetical protein